MREELQLKILSSEKLSPAEKLEVVKWLVSESIEKILIEKIVIAKAATQWKVSLIIEKQSEKDCYESIVQFLSILDCKVIRYDAISRSDDYSKVSLEFSF